MRRPSSTNGLAGGERLGRRGTPKETLIAGTELGDVKVRAYGA